MARKRMFDQGVIDNDIFLEMPELARLLYYDLNMRADDDGFVSSPRKIAKTITGASEKDLEILIKKGFLIHFESGIVVIRHWKVNNYIRKDRYVETIYKEEKKRLTVDSSNIYNLIRTDPTGLPNDDQPVPNGLPNGNQMASNGRPNDDQQELINQTTSSEKPLNYNEKTVGLPSDNQMASNGRRSIVEYSIEENSIDKYSIEKENIKEKEEIGKRKDISLDKNSKKRYGEYKHVLLSDSDFLSLQNTYSNYQELIHYLDEYIEMKGYKAKNHFLCIKKWVVKAVAEEKNRATRGTYNQNKKDVVMETLEGVYNGSITIE